MVLVLPISAMKIRQLLFGITDLQFLSRLRRPLHVDSHISSLWLDQLGEHAFGSGPTTGLLSLQALLWTRSLVTTHTVADKDTSWPEWYLDVALKPHTSLETRAAESAL
jgi:hypothetical protein